jgi:hypothetical protein
LATFQKAKNVALAAHKYQMDSLFETSMSSMEELMGPEHMWVALEVANKLDHIKLKEACIKVFNTFRIIVVIFPIIVTFPQFMQQNTIECITADNFLQISENNMALLLTQDMLNVGNELVLINTAVNWARCEAQRCGLAKDDSGVRAMLKPRLLSLLRLLTLTTEQFVSGPAFVEWLTGEEKKAITNYRHNNETTTLPKHFSNSMVSREKPPLKYNKTSVDTKQFFGTSRSHCINYNYSRGSYYQCLHVSGLFRVTENCNLLGLILPSHHEDDTTVLSPKLHVYNEDMNVTVSDCGTSLLTHITCKKLCNKLYIEQTQYNSTFTINFDEPVQLSSDKWFEIAIDIKIRDGSRGQYPYVKMPKSGSSNGIEFIFHTEQLEGHRISANVDFIQSLILSPL